MHLELNLENENKHFYLPLCWTNTLCLSKTRGQSNQISVNFTVKWNINCTSQWLTGYMTCFLLYDWINICICLYIYNNLQDHVINKLIVANDIAVPLYLIMMMSYIMSTSSPPLLKTNGYFTLWHFIIFSELYFHAIHGKSHYNYYKYDDWLW